jgi:outer membrane protein TolC
MTRISKLIFIFCAAIIIPHISAAQETLKLTLRESLEIALKSNNNIINAQFDYEEGEQKTREVKAQALPQLNASAGYTNNLIVPSIVINDQIIRAGLQYNSTIAAEATQQIFNQSVFTGIKAAKVSEDYYNQNIQRTEEEVIQQTSTLFYQAVSVQAQRNILQSNIRDVEKNFAIAQERLNNGLVRKVDVDRLKVNLTNLNTNLRSLDDNYQNLVNQFKLIIGLDLQTPVELNEPLLNDTTTYRYDPSLLATGWEWENKIEYQQFNTQLKLYDLERQSFSSGYYPTLSAYARFQRQGVSSELMLPDDNSNWYNTSSIGLTLSIPVFDGFRKSAQMQQSKIRRIKTENNMAYTKQYSHTEYQNALHAFETNYSNYLAQKDNVKLATDVYNITSNNYNEGLSPLTELLDAETSMLVSQNELIEALLKVKEAEVNLLRAKGEMKNLLN